MKQQADELKMPLIESAQLTPSTRRIKASCPKKKAWGLKALQRGGLAGKVEGKEAVALRFHGLYPYSTAGGVSRGNTYSAITPVINISILAILSLASISNSKETLLLRSEIESTRLPTFTTFGFTVVGFSSLPTKTLNA